MFFERKNRVRLWLRNKKIEVLLTELKFFARNEVKCLRAIGKGLLLTSISRCVTSDFAKNADRFESFESSSDEEGMPSCSTISMISSTGSEANKRDDFILDSDGYFSEEDERFLAMIGLIFSPFTGHEDQQFFTLLLIPREENVLEKATIEIDFAESNKKPMELFIMYLPEIVSKRERGMQLMYE